MAKEKKSIPYIPDPGLEAAANVALELGLPLLVTGEPGTGKTQLAYWIAHQLDTEVLRFNTKTTSQSKDLFYRYDAIRHFRDSHQHEVNTLDYIQFEALGKAILASGKKRYVVLVDEVDKATRDFSNDLLFEFEKLAFNIAEANETDLEKFDWQKQLGIDRPVFDNSGNITLDENQPKPVLILTSNSEKNLPDAFLRRCAFYHIPFPSPEQLLEIVQIHGFLDEKFTEKLAAKAIEFFGQMREHGLRKKPATAEMLAWLHILKNRNLDPETAANDKETELKIRQTFALLAKNKEDLQRLTEEFRFG
jgi:MoxR-like ATPase